MAEKSIYDQIKKQNGEAFAKAIRTYDNGIFDVPNIVNIVRYAGRDAEPILEYLESLKEVKIEEKTERQSPFELLDKAGYNAYYADTLEKQNAIEKYFIPNERLCTFNDKTRFEKYYIINAIKKNVNKINRKDFKGKEQREDEYGTSVISIQILKTGGHISIKNRYNHTVENPDNTYNSNPDNIIDGLSVALKEHFHVDFSSKKIRFPENFIFMNNQIVHYNYESNNTYFGADFIARDGKIYPLNKDTELMLDKCILNIKDKTLFDISAFCVPIKIDEINENDDSFAFVLARELKAKNIKITKNKDGSHNVLADGIPIVTAKEGQITAVNLPNTIKIGNYFLYNNKVIKTFTAPKLERVGDNFLDGSNELKSLNFPNLKRVGFNSLNCPNLQYFEAPNLEYVGGGFLGMNTELLNLNLPKLEVARAGFLEGNEKLMSFTAPNLKKAFDSFLADNKAIKFLSLPSLEKVGGFFLRDNKCLCNFDAPNLSFVGCEFLYSNRVLQHLNLPKLMIVGDDFLKENQKLMFFNAPCLSEVKDNFFYYNTAIETLDFPMLKKAGENFLTNNQKISFLNAPMLAKIETGYLEKNTSYKTNAPAIQWCILPSCLIKGILVLSHLFSSRKNKQNELTDEQRIKLQAHLLNGRE